MNRLRYETKTISPEEAARMLKTNTRNRVLQQATVDHYAREMKAGLWMMTGEPIQVSNTGSLLNGQHRLQAIILSGRPQTFLIIYGIEDAAMKCIDTGKKRSIGDILSMHSVVNANLVAATVLLCMRYDTTKSILIDGKWTWNPAGGNKNEGGAFVRFRPTAEEEMQFISSHQEVKASVSMAASAYKDSGSRFFAPSMAAFVHFYGAQQDTGKADSFLTQLYRAINVRERSPVQLLRRRLNHSRMGKVVLRPKEQLALAIKAWNMTILGDDEISLLRWSSTEPFPGFQEV